MREAVGMGVMLFVAAFLIVLTYRKINRNDEALDLTCGYWRCFFCNDLVDMNTDSGNRVKYVDYKGRMVMAVVCKKCTGKQMLDVQENGASDARE